MIQRTFSDSRHEDAIGYSRAVAAGPAASRTGAAVFVDSPVLTEAEAHREGL
jgi:hypothetical protein